MLPFSHVLVICLLRSLIPSTMVPADLPEEYSHLETYCHPDVLAAPKVRDSCHACAVSKVKCNKIKPVCGRCTKRGTLCVYVAAKRPIRRSDNRVSGSAKETRDTPQSSSSTASKTSQFVWPGLVSSPAGEQGASYPTCLPGLLPPTNPSLCSYMTNGAGLEDFSGSPINFPSLKTPHYDNILQPYSNCTSTGRLIPVFNEATPYDVSQVNFPILEEGMSEPQPPADSHFPLGSMAFANSNAQNFDGLGTLRTEPHCCCQTRALSFVQELLPSASAANTGSEGPSHEKIEQKGHTVHSIVAENEKIIEALSMILKCSCSQDGYLLSIVSLIVFKVISRYAASACQKIAGNCDYDQTKSDLGGGSYLFSFQKQPAKSLVAVGNCQMNGESQRCMAAQLVLGELHRVQRLINLLSQQLEDHRANIGAIDRTDHPTGGSESLGREIVSPFSRTSLDQLEEDLRNRVHALSLDIVNKLRWG